MKGILTNTSIGRYGRFANGIFQIMGLIGIARKQGFDWTMMEPWVNHDHKTRFGSKEDVEIHNHLQNPMPVNPDLQIQHIGPYEWGYYDYELKPGNCAISGHFQAPAYFMDAIEEVRHYLTFKGEPSNQPYCAVHVRRGDYDNAYHPILGLEYYQPAMEQFPVGTHFLVFSDDLVAAQEMFLPLAETYQITVYPGVDYLADFKMMKRCHSFICANSSFSYAAAILANQPGKRVVMPRNWFGPAWGNPEAMTKDLYLPEAIIL